MGSVHVIEFEDGSYWKLQVVEFSGLCARALGVTKHADLQRTLAFDLLERTDGVQVSGCTHQISAIKITQVDSNQHAYVESFCGRMTHVFWSGWSIFQTTLMHRSAINFLWAS